MRSFKKFGLLAAVFALSAIGAANASAATFTASATGTLSGKATTLPILTLNGGQIKCTTTSTTGTIASIPWTEQKYTITYSGCTAFGFANVHTSPHEFNTKANGEVQYLKTITISVTAIACHITIHPQTVNKVEYTNNSPRTIVHHKTTGIAYTSTGGLCGASGSNGTYTGTTEIERVGGGSVSHDP
ncbi:MAG TPA: hypothetical protein VJU14_03830 [Solirubrobacterales bacterium]|nr:hypothetical protein [Solirubrobacterales bacterium]